MTCVYFSRLEHMIKNRIESQHGNMYRSTDEAKASGSRHRPLVSSIWAYRKAVIIGLAILVKGLYVGAIYLLSTGYRSHIAPLYAVEPSKESYS